MSGLGTTPLFIDTGAFIARFVSADENHPIATAVFDGIRRGEYAYRPLYTSRYVLSELITLLQRRAGHTAAVHVMETILESASFTVLDLDDERFDRTCAEFARYDDQQISFVDHSSGVLADEFGIDHVFTFDPDDFRTLGSIAVPDDTGEG